MAKKDFDVLIQKNGRIQWMSVPGCNTHAEARQQGRQMYAGKVIDTRFNGIDYENKSRKSSSSWNFSGGGSFETAIAALVILLSLGIIAAIWPLVIGGGVCYGIYKLYKWISK